MNEKQFAQCVLVGDRYFVSFDKRGRLVTAHALAGATLFMLSEHAKIHRVLSRIFGNGRSDARVVLLSGSLVPIDD